MPKPIENGQKPLENVFRTPTDCRFWETTAIATHENKERLMYSKGLLLNQIEQMRSYRTFPLVGPRRDAGTHRWAGGGGGAQAVYLHTADNYHRLTRPTFTGAKRPR